MTREPPCSTSTKVLVEDLLEENYYMKLKMFLRLTKSHFLTFESHRVITQGVSPGYYPLGVRQRIKEDHLQSPPPFLPFLWSSWDTGLFLCRSNPF